MPPEINFYNPRSIILFFCILQGIIFSGLLLVRAYRKRSVSDLWLGVLLLIMCSSLVVHFIGFANVYDNNQWLTYFPFELIFALAPTIYLYVQTLTNSKRELRLKDFLFFVPSLFFWLYSFILFSQDMEFKEWFGNNLENQIDLTIKVILFIWNAVFLFASIQYYREYRSWLNENYSDTEIIKFNWLRNFLYIFAIIFLLESIFDAISFFYLFTYIQAYFLRLVIAVATYYLAVAGYLRSETIDLNFSPKEIEPLETETLQEQRDQTEKLESTKDKLKRFMDSEKPYLDSQLTLKELSKQLGTNTTILSHTINKGFSKNFNDFVNEYRVEEIKKILLADSNSEKTFLGVALANGFNSKATFNRAFKKFTGTSPKKFSSQNSQ